MPVTPDIPAVEQHVVELTNEFRARHKRAAVKPNKTLSQAARAFARYLALNDQFSHTADGREPAQRAERAGYEYCQLSENLALNLNSEGFESKELALDTVEGWMNSPAHRKNLLAPHVTEIGIGVVRAPHEHPKYITVQLFGRPKSDILTFQVTNSTNKTITYGFGQEQHTIKPHFAFSHTSCEPVTLNFVAAETKGKRRKMTGEFQPKDGAIFALKPAPDGAVVVKLKKKETLRTSGQ